MRALFAAAAVVVAAAAVTACAINIDKIETPPTGGSIYAAYYDVQRDAVDDYGVYDDVAIDTRAWGQERAGGGVAYADLIDFDGDGAPELLYCAEPDTSTEFHGYYFYVYSYSGKVKDGGTSRAALGLARCGV